MKIIVCCAAFLVAVSTSAFSQKYYTKNGNISFISKTSLENIRAGNNQVLCVLNAQTGEIQFSLLIKSFHFEKALMEEHFNESYMESDKFPRATFRGNITDMGRVNFTTDGMYTVGVSGDMTMHGVTKKINTTGTITVKAGRISTVSSFFVNLADYNITVPAMVRDNIAESVEVMVNANLDQKM